MVTGPFDLDLDPFRSSKSKLELVQFQTRYLRSKSVQFQFRSSSKILPKSSEFFQMLGVLKQFLR